MSRPFEAEHPGLCAHPDCGTGIIKPGQQARYIGGRPAGSPDVLVHVTCPVEPKAPSVCPTCHMALPATGVCDDCA